MNHTGTQTLMTQRLILRRFTPQDAGDAYSGWLSDPDAARYMRWEAYTGIRQTREYLERIVSDYEKSDYYRWAITLKPDGIAVGSIGFYIVNGHDSVAEIAYVLGREYRCRGIVSEALRKVLEYAYETVGINRMEACHACANPASGKVLRKAGMLYEGHAKQKFKGKDGYEDSDLYGLVAEDWRAMKAL